MGPPEATSEAGLTFFSTPFYPYNGNTKIISFAIHARDARLPLTRDRVDETRAAGREGGRGEEIVSFITRSFFSSMARGLAVDSGTLGWSVISNLTG